MPNDDVPPETSAGYVGAKFGKTPRDLVGMIDDQLVIWQHNQANGSTQHAMAEREWQRRLVMEQIKAARFAAWIGIAGVIAGSLLTWGLSQIGGERRDDEGGRSARTENAAPVHQQLPIDTKPRNTLGPGTSPQPNNEGASKAAQQKK
jgi:hypothetical protein